MSKKTDLFWSCTLGEKSHMNMLGKILFSPLVLVVFCFFWTMDRLFTKPEDRWL